ncbi:MAG: hypothetical protein BMS9Abin23_0874 [Thermodesulfobacteriota bacterium]|nr:MAG: hypothetical protein BMS9Abin23_0874 [Thermodesulfobacteriota bacterium]
MSFYLAIKTQLKNKAHVIAALMEMRKRGELLSCKINDKKETIEVDRDGDKIKLSLEKEGNFEVSGDARVVRVFSNRLKQMYALESIKENLPLDFEIDTETETATGEIKLLIKG